MPEILPGILDHSWEEVENKINLTSSFTNKIHIDLVDQTFSKEYSFSDPAPFAKYSKDIFFELHMMVDEPIKYLQAWSSVGIRRFIGHIEKMSSQVEFVAKAQELGEVGLALDIDSSVDQIEVPLEDLDAVLVMLYKAGASGQVFQAYALDKVRALRQRSNFLKVEVDGGITDKTIKECLRAGAGRFVSTSYLFWGKEDAKTRYEKLLGATDSL